MRAPVISSMVVALEAACRIATIAEAAGIRLTIIGASRYHGIVSVLVDSPTDVVLLAQAIGVDVYRIREQPSGPGEGRLGSTVCQLDYIPPQDPDAAMDPDSDAAARGAPGVPVSIVAYGTEGPVSRRRTTVVRKGHPPHRER